MSGVFRPAVLSGASSGTGDESDRADGARPEPGPAGGDGARHGGAGQTAASREEAASRRVWRAVHFAHAGYGVGASSCLGPAGDASTSAAADGEAGGLRVRAGPSSGSGCATTGWSGSRRARVDGGRRGRNRTGCTGNNAGCTSTCLGVAAATRLGYACSADCLCAATGHAPVCVRLDRHGGGSLLSGADGYGVAWPAHGLDGGGSTHDT